MELTTILCRRPTPRAVVFCLLILVLSRAPGTLCYVPSGASGTWTVTGAMGTARYGHTATPLLDGRVLVAGGYSSGVLSSTEVYDPAIGEWANTGDITVARDSHTATPLLDGRVLVAGGYSSGVLSSAELYDPETGEWTST